LPAKSVLEDLKMLPVASGNTDFDVDWTMNVVYWSTEGAAKSIANLSGREILKRERYPKRL
jgi:hypothetical protein